VDVFWLVGIFGDEQLQFLLIEWFVWVLDFSFEIGRAVAQTYEGEADGLAQYVLDEYEYEYAPDNPAMAAIANGHAALDMIGQTAGSVPITPSETDALAKAESERDNAKTLALKSQQLARLIRP
jgi:hypothetical protein